MRLGNGRRRGWAAGLVALGVALAACGPAASQAPGQPPNSGGSTPAQPPNSGIAPAQAPNTAGSAPAQPANPAGSAAAAPGSPAAAGATARPAPEAVTVSWVNSLTIAPFFVAADRGYFEEQGIDLKLEQVQSAADAIAFLATGQLDASFGAVAVALYNAINQGLNVRVAAPIAYDNPELLVRKALWTAAPCGPFPTCADGRSTPSPPDRAWPTCGSRLCSSPG